jgi:hypothetical protein
LQKGQPAWVGPFLFNRYFLPGAGARETRPRAGSYVVVLEICSPSEANCSNGWW